MFVEANGIRFHCQVDGEPGKPWLMLSNSLATNLSMWNDQAAYFAGRYRVLRYDQRGHGLTDAPNDRYTFDLLIADAVALLDALEITRASFCGLSMGGVTAMGLALRHPDRLDRVVVCGSPCVSTPASASSWHDRIAEAETKGMGAMVESTMQRWFSAATLASGRSYLQRVRKMIETTPVAGFVGCGAALADHDFRTGVTAVPLPILLLTGSDDVAAPPMRQMHAAIRGSHFVELADAGHISNLDQPVAFNQAVEAFLNSDMQ